VGQQVPADPMTSDAPTVAGALFWAYQQIKGSEAPARVVLWALALSANETASWKSLYNYNLGNVTTGGTLDWYTNPKVTAPLKFVSYASLGDGAVGMLKAMDAGGMLSAAAAGDMDAFRAGQARYQGTSNPPELSGLIAAYQSVVPAPWSPTPGWVLPVVATAIVAVSGAVAAWIMASGATIAMPRLPRFAFARENPATADRDPEPMLVQSLLFPFDRYSVAEAKQWARRHGYRSSHVETTRDYIHLVQFDPKAYNVRVVRTVAFGKGIKAHVAREAA
jgi:hypothetical protein